MGEFEQAVLALLPRLRRFARALERRDDGADDLVQTTLERALLHRGRWTAGTRLDSWMFTIMKNAWLDEVRARKRRDRFAGPQDLAETVADPLSASAADKWEAVAVQSAISNLPSDQRLAVALVLVEGLSYGEAAAVLQIPIGTLTSRLARARQALVRTVTGATSDGP